LWQDTGVEKEAAPAERQLPEAQTTRGALVIKRSLAHPAPEECPVEKLRECAECRGKFCGRDLVEVMEEHENLTWFVGDELCWEYAKGHGI
jgi:hypothetical protein